MTMTVMGIKLKDHKVHEETFTARMMIFIVLLWIFGFTSVVQSKIDPNSIKDIQDLILTQINELASDFQPCTENLVRKAVFGDMIEIRRRKGYFHWSVFVKNATVIQLNNPEFGKLNWENAFDNFTGQVELRNLMELAGKDLCRINNKLNESKRKGLRVLPNSEIRKKMKEELQRNVTFYNVFDHNCEHFAAELKFGVSFSSQVSLRTFFLINSIFFK